ncbi:unnamed protein product [Ixodes pacificus]
MFGLLFCIVIPFFFPSWSLWFSHFGFSGAGVGDEGRRKRGRRRREKRKLGKSGEHVMVVGL